MSKLLFITAHPLTSKESTCLKIGEEFIKEYKINHPEDEIIEVNLYEQSVPLLDKNLFEAWNKLRKGIKIDELTEEQQKGIKIYDSFGDQFISADKYVFVNPMWNHFLPSILKAYIDTICVVGKTIKYTENGPKGLLEGKKALHIQSSGGIYDHESMQGHDYGHNYLKHIMNFVGIEDVQAIFIDGVDKFRDKAEEIREQAKVKAKEIAKDF